MGANNGELVLCAAAFIFVELNYNIIVHGDFDESWMSNGYVIGRQT